MVSKIKLKRLSEHTCTSQVAHQARSYVYVGFKSMKLQCYVY